jgi:multidrug efflux pump subunit AcrA (membrane-fusion protein)
MRSRLLLAALLSSIVLFLGCGGGEHASTGTAKPKGPLEYPVQVQPAAAGNVTYSVTGVGSVEAFEQVQVVSRVPGAVDTVRFKEGEPSVAGQVLVEIDPERYRLAVEAAKAALQKAQAGRDDAQSALSRRERDPNLFPAEEVQTFSTRASVAAADAAQAQAALQQAQLNLHDAYVRAPIAGIMETRSVQTGQWVAAGSTLATMVPPRAAARAPGDPREGRRLAEAGASRDGQGQRRGARVLRGAHPRGRNRERGLAHGAGHRPHRRSRTGRPPPRRLRAGDDPRGRGFRCAR